MSGNKFVTHGANFYCEGGTVFFNHQPVGGIRIAPYGFRAEAVIGSIRIIAMGADLGECSRLLRQSFSGMSDE